MWDYYVDPTTVISDLKPYKLDIVALQVTRWPGLRNLKTISWTNFYSGELDHQTGVKFVVNKLIPNLKSVNDKV